MRRIIVDSVAAVAFFTLLAGLVEYFVAGLSLDQVLLTRIAALPAILFTGRLYGIWRDFIFDRTGAEHRGPTLRLAADTAAFISFQLPVYGLILILAGASWGQIAAAIGTASVAMILISRPYGLFLDFCRRMAGVTARRVAAPPRWVEPGDDRTSPDPKM